MPRSSVVCGKLGRVAEPAGAFDSVPDDLMALILRMASERRPEQLLEPPPCPQFPSPADVPALREVEPICVLRLARVCRRFRRVGFTHPTLWESLAVQRASSSDIAALAAAPPSALKNVRSLLLTDASLVYEDVHTLYKTPLRCGLRKLRIEFRGELLNEVPVGALPLLRKFEALQSLALQVSDEFSLHFIFPACQAALSLLLKSTRIRTLQLDNISLSSAQLRALSACAAEHLTALTVSSYTAEGESIRPAVQAVAALTRLESLAFFFRGEDGDSVWPPAREWDVAPLEALTALRDLDMGATFGSLRFLHSLTRLEKLSLCTLDVQLDAAPLAALRPTLRCLEIQFDGGPDHDSVVAAIPSLANLECLRLLAWGAEADWAAQLAEHPLGGLARLRELSLETGAQGAPPALLARLAAEVPSLRRLKLEGPLDVPACLEAFDALGAFLQELILDGAGSTGLARIEQELIRAAMPDTAVHFLRPDAASESGGGPEGAQA
eukprot:tig00000718_g3741.t1